MHISPIFLIPEVDVQHDSLLKTCEEALSYGSPITISQTGASNGTNPVVLVFFTHHRPHLAMRDLEFFTKARARGWLCEEMHQEKFPVSVSANPACFPLRSRAYSKIVLTNYDMIAYVSG